MKQLHIYLILIKYELLKNPATGKIKSVGQEWDFNIAVEGAPARQFGRKLMPRKDSTVFKTVFMGDAPKMGEYNIKVAITATEKDKISDTKSVNDIIRVNTTKSGEFETGVELIVEEKGAIGGTGYKGKLTLVFEAEYAEVKNNCKIQNDVDVEIVPLPLSPAVINLLDGVNFGATQIFEELVYIDACLYTIGNSWKAKVQRSAVQILSGVNTDIIKEIILPGEGNSPTVDCSNVKYVIKDLTNILKSSRDFASNSSTPVEDGVVDAFQVAGLSPSDPKANGKFWMNTQAVRDHEMVHVNLRIPLIKNSWPVIRTFIHDAVFGSVDSVSEREANEVKDEILRIAVIKWNEEFRIPVPHESAYVAGDTVLENLKAKAMAFEKTCKK